MVTSAVVVAKRALVVILRTLASLYGVNCACTRDACDEDVLRAFRKVALKVHPDRGGNVKHQQQMNDARRAWETAKAKAKAWKPDRASTLPLASGLGPSSSKAAFRIQAASVLLTYQGLQGPAQWVSLNAFVVEHVKAWNVKHWCTTLEANTASDTFHAHVMIQFLSSVDRSAAAFVFCNIKPNVHPTDLCGEGLCRKKLQVSMDRGFFYVWADKIGTVRDSAGHLCVAGNYAPVWTDECYRYQVLGAWPEKLWKQRKLTTEMYKQYLFLARDGVVARKRNLDAVESEENQLELTQLIADNTKRIRSNPALYQTFPELPEVTAWKALFKQDALRYPVLLLIGQSMSGKTEYAHSLFANALELKIGPLLYFPDKLRAFDRKVHDGIILDDVRDLHFLTENQDKIQGKYSTELEFGTTPGGQCKYEKYLFQVPMVATLNYSTENMSLLDTHDWLSKSGNRVVVHFRGFT